jgi:hypothetical protein
MRHTVTDIAQDVMALLMKARLLDVFLLAWLVAVRFAQMLFAVVVATVVRLTPRGLLQVDAYAAARMASVSAAVLACVSPRFVLRSLC